MKKIITLLGGTLSFMAAFSHAQEIVALSPTAIVNSHLHSDPYEWHIGSVDDLINGQHLNASFVSGATNFDAFIAGNPVATDRSWMASGSPNYTIDFDLGGIHELHKVAIWLNVNPDEVTYSNQGLSLSSIKSFTLSVSDQADFSSSIDLGLFEIAENSTRANVFDFETVAAGRYLRLEINNTFADDMTYIGFNEIVVGSAIPEPSAFAAFAGLGALGIAALRRRRR